LSTREALLATGRAAFADRGYAGARLADIAGEAGLTTGAFYRHFASKFDFFEALFEHYGAALREVLETAPTLHDQIVGWLHVSREHRGVIRASQELARAGSPQAEVARELRDGAATLVARRLQPNKRPNSKRVRGASLMVSDILRQYVLMESAGWIPERDPEAVAHQLEHLIEHGLYR
jgi:AcrR family transcriptional regulator